MLSGFIKDSSHFLARELLLPPHNVRELPAVLKHCCKNNLQILENQPQTRRLGKSTLVLTLPTPFPLVPSLQPPLISHS